MPSRALAAFVSDVHLSAKAPPGRGEKDDRWVEYQKFVLSQVRQICRRHDCALVIAGDLFDVWDPPHSLVEFAVREFKSFPRGVFAVPGQHDLPYHRYADRHKSGYGVLAAAGAVHDLPPDRPTWLGSDCALHAFPWDHEPKPLVTDKTGVPHVAVVHRYVWSGACKYPDAPAHHEATALEGQMPGYDLIVCGDNHKRFRAGRVFNHGTLVERKRDERGLGPKVGLLFADRSLKQIPLDTSKDGWLPEDEDVAPAADPAAGRFVAEVRGLGDTVPDFFEACRRAAAAPGVTPGTRELVARILDTARPRA